MYFSMFSQKSRNLLQKIYLGLWHFTFNKTNHISIDLNLTFVSSLIWTSSEFFSSVFSVTATALLDPFVPFCSFHPLTSSWNPPDWCQKSAIEVSQAPEQCWDMKVFLRDRQLVFKTKLNDLSIRSWITDLVKNMLEISGQDLKINEMIGGQIRIFYSQYFLDLFDLPRTAAIQCNVIFHLWL